MTPDDQMPAPEPTDAAPRKPSRTEQALRAAGYVEPILPPAPPVQPEHIHDLCKQAAANADRFGPHGTQPDTVTPPSKPSPHSVLYGCLIVVGLSTPWFVGLAYVADRCLGLRWLP